MDLYSCRLVGWAVGLEMPVTLVRAALQVAFAQRNPCLGFIVRSDRLCISLHSAKQMQGAGRVGVNPVVLCSTQNAIAGCTLKAYYFFDK